MVHKIYKFTNVRTCMYMSVRVCRPAAGDRRPATGDRTSNLNITFRIMEIHVYA